MRPVPLRGPQDPLNAVKSHLSLPVQDHGPVLREDLFFVPTLRVQVGTRSRIKSGMTVLRDCENGTYSHAERSRPWSFKSKDPSLEEQLQVVRSKLRT